MRFFNTPEYEDRQYTERAAHALVKFIVAQHWEEVHVSNADALEPRTIVVAIGAKPNTYFKPPEMKEEMKRWQDEMERQMKEAERQRQRLAAPTPERKPPKP